MTVSEELYLLEQTKQELQIINNKQSEIKKLRESNKAISESAGDLSWVEMESTENVEKVKKKIFERKKSAIERAYKICGIIVITFMILSAIGFAIILIKSYSTMCLRVEVAEGLEKGDATASVVGGYIIDFIALIVISSIAIYYYNENEV